jgi:hypothetical protein
MIISSCRRLNSKACGCSGLEKAGDELHLIIARLRSDLLAGATQHSLISERAVFGRAFRGNQLRGARMLHVARSVHGARRSAARGPAGCLMAVRGSGGPRGLRNFKQSLPWNE